MAKRSRDALLEICTPLNEVEDILEDRIQKEIRFFRPEWVKSEMSEVFYCLSYGTRDIYLHVPMIRGDQAQIIDPIDPRSGWRVNQIVPLDSQKDVSAMRDRFGKFYLHGFELMDVSVFERSASRGEEYPDASPGGSSYSPDYSSPIAYWYPHMNNLLISLRKDGELLCWVGDNDETTTSESFADNRTWRIDPNEWNKMIGQSLEIFANAYSDKPVYMPNCVWEKHRDMWDFYAPGKSVVTLQKDCFSAHTCNHTSYNPIELVRVIR